jgi:type IV secretory pathway VirB2 component (pilin)
MKKILANKSLWIMVAFVSIFVIATSNGYAEGEQIERSLSRLLEWVTRVLGGLAVGFGIVFTGIKISMGDEQAIKKGGAIIGGGILIFSATWIVELLRTIFQG